MNTKLLIFAGLATGLALQLCPSAMANEIASGTAAPGYVIPDYNYSGVASSITLQDNTGPSHVTSVSVSLTIQGSPTAYDGDYYAYLQFGAGPLIVLMDNPGTTGSYPYGSPGNGMINVTFSDLGSTTIDGAPNIDTSLGAISGGTYLASGGSLNAAFAGINPLYPYGSWTLFVTDTSPGGVGKLVSWGITVAGTPDNGSTLLLLAMGVGCLGLCSMRGRLFPIPFADRTARGMDRL